jgi:hypothetical protein
MEEQAPFVLIIQMQGYWYAPMGSNDISGLLGSPVTSFSVITYRSA